MRPCGCLCPAVAVRASSSARFYRLLRSRGATYEPGALGLLSMLGFGHRFVVPMVSLRRLSCPFRRRAVRVTATSALCLRLPFEPLACIFGREAASSSEPPPGLTTRSSERGWRSAFPSILRLFSPASVAELESVRPATLSVGFFDGEPVPVPCSRVGVSVVPTSSQHPSRSRSGRSVSRLSFRRVVPPFIPSRRQRPHLPRRSPVCPFRRSRGPL